MSGTRKKTIIRGIGRGTKRIGGASKKTGGGERVWPKRCGWWPK